MIKNRDFHAISIDIRDIYYERRWGESHRYRHFGTLRYCKLINEVLNNK